MTLATGTLQVVTQPLGGSPLSRAARAGQLPEWYRPAPRTPAEWTAYARDVASSVSRDWLSELEPAIVPRGAAAARLRGAAQASGIVVTTGQQPGLFGGALMTFIKALSARAHADLLQETLGIPVAPLFWAATDDADFDEAAAVSVALEGGARELRLAQRSAAGTPMALTPLGPEVRALAALLRDACGSASHAHYLNAALAAYVEGATVGDAYLSLLRDVLEPLEISVIDASHPAVSRAAASTLRRAARDAAAVAGALAARDSAIAAAGFSVQVESVEGMSLVFLNEHGMKRRLPIDEATGLGTPPQGTFLSPTALLRPVVERAILPTAAYVGGPGEVAYFAQVSAVAAAVGVAAPLVVPRWSATVVEPRVQRILDELGLDLDAFADPHRAEAVIAARRVPAAAAAAIAAMRSDVERSVAALGAANGGLVAGAVLDGFRHALAHRIDRLERRVLAAVKRRETDAMARVATARGSLFPHGVRQERKLGFTPFLARYGQPLIDDMLVAARVHARTSIHQPPAPSPTQSSAAPARV
ncbi:MAG TPA: bacillithiol biosynthesis BshC [Gemmatimonadaceae bacterium]|nr:bacillithiol biosynthesis BshC [Gemmatimonadaceae bacterium]